VQKTIIFRIQKIIIGIKQKLFWEREAKKEGRKGGRKEGRKDGSRKEGRKQGKQQIRKGNKIVGLHKPLCPCCELLGFRETLRKPCLYQRC